MAVFGGVKPIATSIWLGVCNWWLWCVFVTMVTVGFGTSAQWLGFLCEAEVK